ncbi:hypothetical protein EVAR_45803_1 [Eumeta japonica]|uniref:Uncharacterized protein n=1 Tax=Eumeta variegata TaxID=151549 RepID=A0A4C1WZX0_EUMVA|nr:hypothetical protein EVAR_45803_1 [Eumeta japonica]
MKDLVQIWSRVTGRQYAAVDTAEDRGRELGELAGERPAAARRRVDVDAATLESNAVECEALNSRFDQEDFAGRREAIISRLFERRRKGQLARQPKLIVRNDFYRRSSKPRTRTNDARERHRERRRRLSAVNRDWKFLIVNITTIMIGGRNSKKKSTKGSGSGVRAFGVTHPRSAVGCNAKAQYAQCNLLGVNARDIRRGFRA